MKGFRGEWGAEEDLSLLTGRQVRQVGRMPRTEHIFDLKPPRSLNNFRLMLAQLRFIAPQCKSLRGPEGKPLLCHKKSEATLLILHPAFSLGLPLVCWLQHTQSGLGGAGGELKAFFPRV